MEQTIITFSADEQKLLKTGGIDYYASNIVDYVEARFELGDNWTGYDGIRAIWHNGSACISTDLAHGTCIVPAEVLAVKGAVTVNLVGTITTDNVLTDRLTTYPVVALWVKAEARICGDNTQPVTPSEFEQFVAIVKEDADRAEAGADNAEASAESAETFAGQAGASASEAHTYAQSAQTYAQNAQNYAVSAETAKDDAIDAKEDAESAKADAESARDQILGMRATANTLAEGSDATASYSNGLLTLGIPRGNTGAKGDKGNKGDTGATPNLSIGTVETLPPTGSSEVTITGTAENPVLNFKLVKGDTGEVTMAQLAQLLPTDTASGDIASFPDGTDVFPAVSVLTTIEPIQDLNGYDKPWSGGAGKNKLQVTATSKTLGGITYTVNSDGSIKADGTASGWGGVYKNAGRASLKANTQYTLYAGGGISGTYYLDLLNGTTKLATTAYQSGVSFTPTEDVEATLDVCVHYNKTVNAQTMYPMICLASETDATFAPYSNICPISGHTECVTSVVGKNWLSCTATTATKGGVTFTVNDDGTAVVNGTASGWSGVYQSYGTAHLKANTEYKLCSEGSINGTLYCDVYNGSTIITTTQYSSYPSAFSVDEDTTVTLNIVVYYSKTVSNATIKPMIRLASETDSTYEPYNGNTYTTNLGRTVYGGTLDIVSGELVVDRAMVDLGTLNWIKYSGNYSNLFYANDNSIKQTGGSTILGNAICSQYAICTETQVGGSGYTEGYFAIGGTSSRVWVNDTRYTDATAFKTAVTGQTLVYELSTPQTYQLTPTEVQLLLGQNNLWTDCGSVNVTYKADTYLWVEKKLS